MNPQLNRKFQEGCEHMSVKSRTIRFFSHRRRSEFEALGD